MKRYDESDECTELKKMYGDLMLNYRAIIESRDEILEALKKDHGLIDCGGECATCGIIGKAEGK